MKKAQKISQLESSLREGSAILKQMDKQIKENDYKGLLDTLNQSKGARRKMSALMKKGQ